MKKMMVAVAVVAMAVAAQASALKWGTTTGLVQGGTTDVMASGMQVYLCDITESSVADLFTAVKSGTFASIADTTTNSDGKITAKEVEYDVGTYNFAMVAIDGDNFFISNALTSKKVTTLSPVAVNFSIKSQSSSGTYFDADAGYQGAGWYQAVPEPTSGLLMLLGMAGLALRRRRA